MFKKSTNQSLFELDQFFFEGWGNTTITSCLVNPFDKAEEKEFNPRLTKSKADFVELMSNLNLSYPKKIDLATGVNYSFKFKITF